MSDGEELLVKIIIWIIIGLPLILIGLLPTWFILHGNWSSYLQWMPWSIMVSGYLYKLCIIVYPLIGIARVKGTYIIAGVYAALLGVWGMPLLKTSLIQLASIPLSGLELQRVVLTIIAINGLAISATLGLKKEYDTDD